MGCFEYSDLWVDLSAKKKVPRGFGRVWAGLGGYRSVLVCLVYPKVARVGMFSVSYYVDLRTKKWSSIVPKLF